MVETKSTEKTKKKVSSKKPEGGENIDTSNSMIEGYHHNELLNQSFESNSRHTSHNTSIHNYNYNNPKSSLKLKGGKDVKQSKENNISIKPHSNSIAGSTNSNNNYNSSMIYSNSFD